MSEPYTKSLNRLIEEFGKLPGVGPKTAERLAFHILKSKPDEAIDLAKAIKDVKDKIKRCKIYAAKSALALQKNLSAKSAPISAETRV
jgi:recombination protein RecR